MLARFSGLVRQSTRVRLAAVQRCRPQNTSLFAFARTASTSASTRALHTTGVVTKAVKSGGGGYLQTGHLPDFAMDSSSQRVLVTGCSGQVGSEVLLALMDTYGVDNVIASDIKKPSKRLACQFVYLDVMNRDQIARIVLEQGIDIIVHFASILSALGEQLPELAIKLNTRSIENVLEVAKNNDVAVFSPSSIAAFGPDTPRHNTPDDTLMRPTTVYGITKVYTELLGEYYHKRYDVDFRSIRYPGVISSEVPPGGGTTDYAVDIYRQALLKRKYKCFLGPSTVLPMMHMSDCVKATMLLMGADSKDLTRRTYNVSGFSFSPEEQVLSIQKIMPDFECTYEPDFRQAIAESWPASLDDSNARKDWGWEPTHTIDSMSEVMLDRLTEIFEEEGTEIAGK